MSKKLQEKVENYLGNKTQENFNNILDYYRPKFNYTSSTWGSQKEDIQQEMSICLLKSLETYNPNRNVVFNTYFWHNWHNHVGTIKIRKKAKKRGGNDTQEPLSLNQKISNEDDTEHQDQVKCKRNEIEQKEKQIAFTQLLDSIKELKKQERKMLELFYYHQSITDVAKELKCSTANVCITMKRIATRPYSTKIYNYLKEV